MNTPVEFVVSIPTNGEVLKGKFKVKVRLSFRERLRMDELRRSLLGAKSAEASAEAEGLAAALAKIQVHMIEAPSWWKDNGNGLEFEDPNIVLSVLEEVTKAEQEYLAGLKKDGDSARADLAKE
jgi:hypothetical protein